MANGGKFLEKLVGPATVGMILRTYRTTHDMKQGDLAKKLKVTVGFISNIETGKKNISLTKLLQICHKLGGNELFWMTVYFEEQARLAGMGKYKITLNYQKSA